MVRFGITFIIMITFVSYVVISFLITGITRKLSKRKTRFISMFFSVLYASLSLFFRIFAVAMVHLFFILMITKLINFFIQKFYKKYKGSFVEKIYKSGIVAITATALVLSLAYVNMNTVHQTNYNISSNKLKNSYKIVFFSDLHYGTVQRKSVLKQKVEEINNLKPDVILFGGDIIEESVTRDNMLECFSILGKLKSKYGSYFVYGNHDRRHYLRKLSYTEADLKKAIEDNGIKILKDDIVLIENDLQILGREDIATPKARLAAESLQKEIDQNKFLLTVDHKPTTITENTALGTDLQLSGHTHAGQIFPVGHLTFLYDGYVYGEYEFENAKLFVSSGFAGWGFPLRTQGISEYVVVNLTAENQ